jgi:hypothetical protein
VRASTRPATWRPYGHAVVAGLQVGELSGGGGGGGAGGLGAEAAGVDVLLGQHSHIVQALHVLGLALGALGGQLLLHEHGLELINLCTEQSVVQHRHGLAGLYPVVLVRQHLRHSETAELGGHRRLLARGKDA